MGTPGFSSRIIRVISLRFATAALRPPAQRAQVTLTSARSTLTGEANLLVFPNLDSANISLGLVRSMTDALHVGPILLGAAKPVHILTPSATVRRVVNMTALTVADASAAR